MLMTKKVTRLELPHKAAASDNLVKSRYGEFRRAAKDQDNLTTNAVYRHWKMAALIQRPSCDLCSGSDIHNRNGASPGKLTKTRRWSGSI